MTSYSLAEIAGLLSNSIVSAEIVNPSLCIKHLLTDSRSLTYPESTLFFALSSGRGDGHRYIDSLYRSGVRAFVVSTRPEGVYPDASFIVVSDTLKALQELGEAHRRRFDRMSVIAVTGSQGKTTVKEMLYQLLVRDHSVARSPRSYNSRIGVPLSLWQAGESDDMAIIEAGISERGEMDRLAGMIRPTIGVFTCLSNEHDAGFSSRAEKASEKMRLFLSSGSVIFPADDPDIAKAAESLRKGVTRLTWTRCPDSDAYLTVTGETVNPVLRSTTLTYRLRGGDEASVTVPFTERHDIDNCITSLVLLNYLGYANHEIASRMAALSPVGTRLDVMEGIGDSMLILDSFTSDLQSLPSALDFMSRRRTSGRRSTVILSDMIHDPGRVSPSALYSSVADLLRRKDIDRVIGIGNEITGAAAAFASWGDHASFYPSADAFIAATNPADFHSQLILIKGSSPAGFDHIADHLEARQHETMLEVNLDAVSDNYNWFRSHIAPSTGIICMVKASGYGAGSSEIAKTLQSRGAAYVAVAVVDEGVALRNAGITMPIMVMNPKVAGYRTMFAHRLEPEVYSFDLLGDILDAARRCGERDFPIHIKIDSGMHRLGFRLEDLDRLGEILHAPENIGLLRPSSVFSHLSVADCPAEDDYTRMQFDYFDRASSRLRELFPEFTILRHILNSTGIVRFPEYCYDMVRLGIGLYGIKTMEDGSQDGLRPVSALYTSVIAVNEWPEGTTIGYGRYGRCTRRSRIATIPVGYADGLDRHLGRGAMSVFIRGQRCPTIGNICMDACMIDVTDLPECHPGDRVEIFGPNIPAAELAEILGTIPYEILTSVSERVKRIYYRE